MKPSVRLTYLARFFYPCLLFLSLFVVACGTIQVDLAASPEPTFSASDSSSPTPAFEEPQPMTKVTVASPTPNEATPDLVTPAASETPETEDAGAGASQESLLARVAYPKDGNVWTWDPVNGPQQLTESGGVENVWLSDDGQRVAFRRGEDIWVVESDSRIERQLTQAADFEGLNLDPELEPFITGITPYQVAWRPGSHQLFFNTSPRFEGPGLFLSDDLWMADADSGELTMVLEPGQGGNFAFSPDGLRLAMTTPGRIDLMDVDGTNRREAFTHTPVITFSEFEYYAQPVWAPDSGSLRVAIPPADSSAASAQPTSIWYIPVEDMPARLIGQITTVPRSHTPPLFDPNLARLAYLVGEQPAGDPGSDLPDIAVAELGESVIWEPVIFPAKAESIHGWSPDGIRLLFTSPTATLAEIAMGQAGINPLINGEGQSLVLNVAWIDNLRYLYLQQSPSGWDILLGDVNGSEPVVVDSVTGIPVSYDFTQVSSETSGQ